MVPIGEEMGLREPFKTYLIYDLIIKSPLIQPVWRLGAEELVKLAVHVA
jgi:hypothetical protein